MANSHLSQLLESDHTLRHAIASRNRATLERALAEVRGTSFAEDLERIQTHVERYDAFPEIE